MSRFSPRKLTFLILTLLGLWLAFRFLLPILMPFLLGILLALAAEPLVHTLQRIPKLPRTGASIIGVSIALVIALLLVVTLCAFLLRELGSLAGVLPDLEDAAISGLSSLEQWLTDLAQKAPQGISPILTQGVEGMFSNGNALLDRLTSWLLTLASTILKALPNSALGFGTWVLASFMLSSRLPRIRQWISGHLPDAWHTKYLPHLKTLKKTLLGWLLAQAKLVAVTFVILAVGFFIIQIDHPLLWASVVCLVDILPILGTGTILIPWSLVCFLQGNNLHAIGLLAIYGIISLLRSVLEPRLVGKQLGLDPLVTLIALYAGYHLWGILGMLFAPILAVVVTQILFRPQNTP